MLKSKIPNKGSFRLLSDSELKFVSGGSDEAPPDEGPGIDVIGNIHGLTIEEALGLIQNGNFSGSIDDSSGGAGNGDIDISDIDDNSLLTPEQRDAILESIETLITSLEELIAEFGDFDITLGDLRINAKVLADGLGALGDGLTAGFLIGDIINGDAGVAETVVLLAGLGAAAGLAVAFGPAATTLGGAVTIIAGVLAAERATELIIENFGNDLENSLIELRDRQLAIIEQNQQNIEQFGQDASQFSTQSGFFNFIINLVNPNPDKGFVIDPENVGPEGLQIPGGHNDFPSGF